MAIVKEIPWRIKEGADGITFVMSGDLGRVFCYVQTEEYGEEAQHVVRAVNCHDELLSELRRVVAYAEKLERAQNLDSRNVTLDAARSAIAKAEGRS